MCPAFQSKVHLDDVERAQSHEQMEVASENLFDNIVLADVIIFWASKKEKTGTE